MMLSRSQLLPLLCLLVLGGCTSEERWYTDSQVTAGKALFQTNCMVCHGVEAAGLGEDWEQKLPGFPGKPPALNGSAHAWHHPMKFLLAYIEEGGAALGGKMPAFGDSLSQDEKLAIIAYFQSFWDDETYGIWQQVNEQNP
ncbi:MAG: c-type cytochrome [Thiolinea sp.]